MCLKLPAVRNASQVVHVVLHRCEPLESPTVTDLPLDDNFDAATAARDSEVYRVWEDDAGSAYDSVEYTRRQNTFKNIYGGDGRMRRNSESLLTNTKKERQPMTRNGNGSRILDGRYNGGSLSRVKSDGSHEKTELVEHRVLEDGPTRTITVWREQVASSSEDNVTHIDLDTQSRKHGHKRTPSGNLSQGSESVRSKSRDTGRNGRPSLERSLPRSPLQRNLGESPHQFQLLEEGRFSPIAQQRAGSPKPNNANFQSARKVSPSTSRSGNRGANHSGSSQTSTSTLELLLSSCQPSLIHLTQKFQDLGILKEEYLRAIAKMNDETRDREIKEEALKMGVTVVEWAIFLDKLRNLYSYDDMYT